MRIAAIAVVFIALIAFGIYLTGGSSPEEDTSSSSVAATGAVKTSPSPSAVIESLPRENSSAEISDEQQEHAKQMAHGMAAQHARHENAMQGEGQEHTVHWGYRGPGAPANWSALSADYAICGSGRNQSPVDLRGFVDAELPDLDFNYSGMAVEILNNGHTVQANYVPGAVLVIDGRGFELKQFHFHAPSENLIDGKSYPLEAHLVHADKDGNLAVVSVLYELGDANNALAGLWSQMPEKSGDKVILNAQVKAGDLLPKNRDYYRFNGSLTTPPCSQGVIWLVMKDHPTVSRQQVEQFTRILGGPNNRPVQPLNARLVLE